MSEGSNRPPGSATAHRCFPLNRVGLNGGNMNTFSKKYNFPVQ